MEKIVLLHGSNRIIENPDLKHGKLNNDYGRGFYCTRERELAAEWATYRDGGSFINEYEIDISGLKILNLEDNEYGILHWITILLEHRVFDIVSPVMAIGKEFLIENYHLDLSAYDIIIGYRADDSYFSFSRDFINNTLPIEGLGNAVRLGDIGIQYCIRSEKAFSRLKYVGSEEVDRSHYVSKRIERDKLARLEYVKVQREYALKGKFLRDIIKGDG